LSSDICITLGKELRKDIFKTRETRDFVIHGEVS
jgi:hypothetical protein